MAFSVFLAAVLLSLVTTVIFWALNGLILRFVANWLDFDDDTFATAYKTAGLAAIVSFLLSLIPTAFSSFFLELGRVTAFLVNGVFILVNAFIFVWLIQRMYYQTWGKSAIAWLILFVANIILGFIVGLLIAALATAFAFNAAQFV
jgi:predicted DNA repair protein MutK